MKQSDLKKWKMTQMIEKVAKAEQINPNKLQSNPNRCQNRQSQMVGLGLGLERGGAAYGGLRVVSWSPH